MKTHELKILPDHYREVAAGRKTYEVRRNDRGFEVGDVLHLLEWSPAAGWSASPTIVRRVSHVLRGSDLVAPGCVVLGLEPMLPTRLRLVTAGDTVCVEDYDADRRIFEPTELGDVPPDRRRPVAMGFMLGVDFARRELGLRETDWDHVSLDDDGTVDE